MKSVFEFIEYLFVEILFYPYDLFRKFEESSWWGANLINWLFMFICIGYLIYVHKQILIFKRNNEDNQDTTAHSFLK